MDLHTIQLVFYTLGSILFIIALLLILTAIIVFFIIKRKINRVTRQVNGRISQAWDMYDHKEKYFLQLISKGSSLLMENLSNIFFKSKK